MLEQEIETLIKGLLNDNESLDFGQDSTPACAWHNNTV